MMDENRLGHRHDELECAGCGTREALEKNGKMRTIIQGDWIMRLCPDCLYDEIIEEIHFRPR